MPGHYDGGSDSVAAATVTVKVTTWPGLPVRQPGPRPGGHWQPGDLGSSDHFEDADAQLDSVIPGRPRAGGPGRLAGGPGGDVGPPGRLRHRDGLAEPGLTVDTDVPGLSTVTAP